MFATRSHQRQSGSPHKTKSTEIQHYFHGLADSLKQELPSLSEFAERQRTLQARYPRILGSAVHDINAATLTHAMKPAMLSPPTGVKVEATPNEVTETSSVGTWMVTSTVGEDVEKKKTSNKWGIMAKTAASDAAKVPDSRPDLTLSHQLIILA